jgi:hypothetical protein
VVAREENRALARPQGMTTHSVNQELAKHHYATLMREAQSHRLATESRPEKRHDRPSVLEQLTWAFRSLGRRAPTIKPA